MYLPKDAYPKMYRRIPLVYEKPQSFCQEKVKDYSTVNAGNSLQTTDVSVLSRTDCVIVDATIALNICAIISQKTHKSTFLRLLGEVV